MTTYKTLYAFFFCTYIFFTNTIYAAEVPIYDFPIVNYSQNIQDYLPENSKDYLTPLIDTKLQQQKFNEFFRHYFTDNSPWNENMLNDILPMVKIIELKRLAEFTQNKHFGENFQSQDEKWFENVINNMNLNNFEEKYLPAKRAIAINNTLLRALPEYAPVFYHFTLPGQGFPFDTLQESKLLAATPVYILHTSKDKAWALVLTPDCFFAWVNMSDIAYASDEFINTWRKKAQEKLLAITKRDVSIVDKHEQFKFKGHLGAIFPLLKHHENKIEILIPLKDSTNHAQIISGFIPKNSGNKMPLVFSKKNSRAILSQLQNQPYGWGGLYFFNDCSLEMKNFFTPFGIWLPRNSAQQAYLNDTIDLSTQSLDTRLATLKQIGKPLRTIIYIKGHVMLYVGTKTIDNEQVITYQNVWGLSPKNKDKRYIIGKSVFLPLLKSYPEIPQIASQADNVSFKLIFIDKLNDSGKLTKAFIESNLK